MRIVRNGRTKTRLLATSLPEATLSINCRVSTCAQWRGRFDAEKLKIHACTLGREIDQNILVGGITAIGGLRAPPGWAARVSVLASP